MQDNSKKTYAILIHAHVVFHYKSRYRRVDIQTQENSALADFAVKTAKYAEFT